MNHLAIVFSCVLSMFVTASAAQEPNRRVNLDVFSNSPLSTIVVARISFAEGDSECPEDRGQLRISSGTLALIRPIPTDLGARERYRELHGPCLHATILFEGVLLVAPHYKIRKRHYEIRNGHNSKGDQSHQS